MFWDMKHKYLIRTKKMSVYWRGSYCLIEADFPGFTIQLFTKKGLLNYFRR